MADVEWSTGYPAALDTVTQMPTMVNGATGTRVSQAHALRDAVQALEAEVGKTTSPAAGSARARLTALEVLTTKGDVLGYSTVPARVPVGSNGQVITADSAQPLGVKWATPAVGSDRWLIFRRGGDGSSDFSVTDTTYTQIFYNRITRDSQKPPTKWRIVAALYDANYYGEHAILKAWFQVGAGSIDEVEITAAQTTTPLIYAADLTINTTNEPADSYITCHVELKASAMVGVAYCAFFELYAVV